MVIGGYQTHDGLGRSIPHANAKWFKLTLTRESAGWAFKKGEPFRTIASLELFATLLCVMAFGKEWPTGAAGCITLNGVTDNAGNAHVVTKMMTSKFPLVVILAELSVQLRARSMALRLGWAPRDQNEEADALTNLEFSSFAPGRRVDIDLGRMEWLILPEMMAAAEGIYETAKAARSSPAVAVDRPAGKKRKLRERDPW